jgi:hypothetical protein
MGARPLLRDRPRPRLATAQDSAFHFPSTRAGGAHRLPLPRSPVPCLSPRASAEKYLREVWPAVTKALKVACRAPRLPVLPGRTHHPCAAHP